MAYNDSAVYVEGHTLNTEFSLLIAWFSMNASIGLP